MAGKPPVILLLGPRRWPGARDPEAGLGVRRRLAAENAGRAGWLVMEEDFDGPAAEADHAKFFRLARRATSLFLVWPKGTQMEGTMDEVVLLLALAELEGRAVDLTVFHERGALTSLGELSPYVKGLLALKPALVEWTDGQDLRVKVRAHLAHLERPGRA